MKRFFTYIILPSILAIVLFILAVFVFILPATERNIMEEKKLMISELTKTVCSLIGEYNEEAQLGNISIDSAQSLAIERVSRIRYGEELKDYFWIIDHAPRMIMHPYRPGLNGSLLDTYKDPDGKLLFVESAELVQKEGSGFIDYIWQWKDDSTRIVPKLSYVQAFDAWDWIVGTGIYLEDVREDIAILKGRLVNIALIITVITSILLTIIIRQSLGLEQKRNKAEQKLRLSREKYKSLVEASTEGTLMFINEKIIFANLKFSVLSGFDTTELGKRSLEELFSINWADLKTSFEDPKKSVSRETILNCKDKSSKNVVISISQVDQAGQPAYIMIVKEVSSRMEYSRETAILSADLQTSVQYMNRNVMDLASPLIKCSSETTIAEAAALMKRKNSEILFIEQDQLLIGMISSRTIVERVLAEDLDPGRAIISIMSSPIPSVSEKAHLQVALVKMKMEGSLFLALKGSDGKYTGVIGPEELAVLQQKQKGFLLYEIQQAESTGELKQLYQRLPGLIRALLESGSNSENLSALITAVADAIHRRLIQLCEEELPPPPCKYTFMVLGSQGRAEQTLATDQDNAIIYEDNSETEEEIIRTYFLALGSKVCDRLNNIGYKYCEGEVMAKNPKWTASLSTWKSYFSEWIKNSSPQDILDAAIFFDFRHIYGEDTLVNSLREHVNGTSDSQAVFFYHMAQSVLKFKPPTSQFGHLRSDSDSGEASINIKKLLLPVTSLLRLYSIQEKLSLSNSIERLEALQKRKKISPAFEKELKEALRYLTQFRLNSQTSSIIKNETPGNELLISEMSEIEIGILKKLISIISDVQTRISGEFRGVEG